MPPPGLSRWRDAVTALPLAVGALALAALVGGGVGFVVALVVLVIGGAARPAQTARLARRTWRVLCLVVGTLAAVVALDWGLGTAWDALTGSDGSAAPREGQTVVDLVDVDLPAARDPRVHSEALRDAPWADRYFAEIEAQKWTYVPFIGPREVAVRGRYLNAADGVRRSYEPEGALRPDTVEVWFFGGSTMWGEGQRDLHTIPSEVARLAEEDGVVLRAVNFGQRGYSAFQELLLFEQELAEREPPDVVVFYDGVNELGTQTETAANVDEQPSIYQYAVNQRAFEREPSQPGVEHRPEPSVLRDYVQTSALHKVGRALASLGQPDPAAAQELPPLSDAERARAVDNAAAIYRRTVRLIDHVASRAGLEPQLFWQPTVPREDNPDYYRLTDRVEGLATDLSGVLADVDSPVFIDGGHTNERGARLVAEALWQHLAPVVREAEAP